MRREPGAGASQESERCPQAPPSRVCQAGSAPKEQTSTRPSWHLPETPRPACKQAHHALGVEWGKPASSHATPDLQGLAPVPAAGSWHCPPPPLMPGLPAEATHPINNQVYMKRDCKVPMFFTLVKLWSSVRLSFIMMMHLYGYACFGQLPEQLPCSQKEFALYFHFLHSTGFSGKAQNAVSTRQAWTKTQLFPTDAS